MKKFLFYIFLCALIVNCKKDNQPKLLDITGTWKMNTLASGSISASLDQYPCLENNVMVINSDGSGVGNYTGTTACTYSSSSPFYNIVLGSPDEGTTQITWTRTGNNVVFKQVSPQGVHLNFYGTIGSANNKTVLSIIDTLNSTIQTQTYTK